ncbi:dethiobiotin synthase [Catenovulum sp. SM1970]|uniref:dethiobiotin synthase n=1 Tax=Marinifaba aquimaris TaxID=2741323 RepID=UPI00157224AF|nr:dethiobiotin synthase [Marinifaba aquimaris]NTS76020.1 dethiobiotin synthase [Marinifaba aquimaris]
MKNYFITATDTDSGKTFITDLILAGLKVKGNQVVGFKPISAGCNQTPEGLRNEDALILQAQSNVELDYQVINPIAFEPPIAPHIAASLVDTSLSMSLVDRAFNNIEQCALNQNTDYLFTEGAGGWLLPLNTEQTLADWVASRQIDVIFVVGLKLGCLNHALLTYQAIKAAGVKVKAWVANQVSEESMPYQAENIAHLKSVFDAPCLGVVPFCENDGKTSQQIAGKYLDLSSL